MTYLSNRISDYYYISQGKTRIYGVNDGEEFQITDVSAGASHKLCDKEHFYEHN